MSISRWCTYRRVAVLRALHRGQRDTILWPYFINWAALYPLPLPQLRSSYVLTNIIYSSSPYSSESVAAAAVSLAPVSSITACSHHHILAVAPFFLSAASQKSRSYCVSICCANVFWFRRMYVSIILNHTSTLAASDEVYFHFPSSLLQRILPISRRATWFWKSPRTRPMRGVTSHVSAPKSNTDCTINLKKNPYTCGNAPSLLWILIILL